MSRPRKKPAFPPSLTLLEEKLGPAREWSGRCYEIATACVVKGLVDGVAVYGHWLGEISPGSIFASKRNVGFAQHGWVHVSGNRNLIFDPTRWAFEDVDPYLYFGPNQGEYDEGGNEWKKAMMRDVPRFEGGEKIYYFNKATIASAPWSHVERLLGGERYLQDLIEAGYEPGHVTVGQMFWIANLPYDHLEPHAREIYEALRRLGNQAAVPIDNWDRAQRERRRR